MSYPPLKRLSIPKGKLCVVGTSATLDDQASETMAGGPDGGAVDAGNRNGPPGGFAGALFEEEITPEAVVGEDRLEVEEIVNANPEEVDLPDPAVCSPVDGEDALGYAQRLTVSWGGPLARTSEDAKEQELLESEWLLELGGWLKKKKLFKIVLETFPAGRKKQTRSFALDQPGGAGLCA